MLIRTAGSYAIARCNRHESGEQNLNLCPGTVSQAMTRVNEGIAGWLMRLLWYQGTGKDGLRAIALAMQAPQADKSLMIAQGYSAI